MKILFGLVSLFICLPVVAQNYQAGGANRPNFGRSAALEQNEASAPGATSNVKTRTFSNYSSRHGNWSQGVKTQGVQTQTAGTVQQPSAPQTFEEQVAQTDRAVDARLTGQRPGAAGAVAPTGKKAAAPQPTEEKPADTAPGAAQAAPGAAAAAGDPAAALAQMQNLMKSMENLQKLTGAMGGMAGTAAAGSNAGGANSAANKQLTDAMNTHSKDISAFMNAAGASAGK